MLRSLVVASELLPGTQQGMSHLYSVEDQKQSSVHDSLTRGEQSVLLRGITTPWPQPRVSEYVARGLRHDKRGRYGCEEHRPVLLAASSHAAVARGHRNVALLERSNHEPVQEDHHGTSDSNADPVPQRSGVTANSSANQSDH